MYTIFFFNKYLLFIFYLRINIYIYFFSAGLTCKRNPKRAIFDHQLFYEINKYIKKKETNSEIFSTPIFFSFVLLKVPFPFLNTLFYIRLRVFSFLGGCKESNSANVVENSESLRRPFNRLLLPRRRFNPVGAD